jgi:hypothetical protein
MRAATRRGDRPHRHRPPGGARPDQHPLPPRIELARLGAAAFFIRGEPGVVEQVYVRASRAGDLNADGQPDFAFAAGPSREGAERRVHAVYGPYGGVPFTRGDASFDGSIEITDAIFTLSYLFLGSEAPRCADATDADDDGKLLLTDAVYLLGHLFLGGPAPGAPYPRSGADPTEDELGCRGF